MGAFSLRIGLTGNLFDLWGLTGDPQVAEPADPPAQPAIEPVEPAIEDAPEQRTGTRGAEQ